MSSAPKQDLPSPKGMGSNTPHNTWQPHMDPVSHEAYVEHKHIPTPVAPPSRGDDLDGNQHFYSEEHHGDHVQSSRSLSTDTQPLSTCVSTPSGSHNSPLRSQHHASPHSSIMNITVGQSPSSQHSQASSYCAQPSNQRTETTSQMPPCQGDCLCINNPMDHAIYELFDEMKGMLSKMQHLMVTYQHQQQVIQKACPHHHHSSITAQRDTQAHGYHPSSSYTSPSCSSYSSPASSPDSPSSPGSGSPQQQGDNPVCFHDWLHHSGSPYSRHSKHPLDQVTAPAMTTTPTPGVQLQSSINQGSSENAPENLDIVGNFHPHRSQQHSLSQPLSSTTEMMIEYGDVEDDVVDFSDNEVGEGEDLPHPLSSATGAGDVSIKPPNLSSSPSTVSSISSPSSGVVHDVGLAPMNPPSVGSCPPAPPHGAIPAVGGNVGLATTVHPTPATTEDIREAIYNYNIGQFSNNPIAQSLLSSTLNGGAGPHTEERSSQHDRMHPPFASGENKHHYHQHQQHSHHAQNGMVSTNAQMESQQRITVGLKPSPSFIDARVMLSDDDDDDLFSNYLRDKQRQQQKQLQQQQPTRDHSSHMSTPVKRKDVSYTPFSEPAIPVSMTGGHQDTKGPVITTTTTTNTTTTTTNISMNSSHRDATTMPLSVHTTYIRNTEHQQGLPLPLSTTTPQSIRQSVPGSSSSSHSAAGDVYTQKQESQTPQQQQQEQQVHSFLHMLSLDNAESITDSQFSTIEPVLANLRLSNPHIASALATDGKQHHHHQRHHHRESPPSAQSSDSHLHHHPQHHHHHHQHRHYSQDSGSSFSAYSRSNQTDEAVNHTNHQQNVHETAHRHSHDNDNGKASLAPTHEDYPHQGKGYPPYTPDSNGHTTTAVDPSLWRRIRVGIDVGGTLAKICYFAPYYPHPSQSLIKQKLDLYLTAHHQYGLTGRRAQELELDSELLLGKLHFVKFDTTRIGQFFELVISQGLGMVDLYATGGGAIKYRTQFLQVVHGDHTTMRPGLPSQHVQPQLNQQQQQQQQQYPQRLPESTQTTATYEHKSPEAVLSSLNDHYDDIGTLVSNKSTNALESNSVHVRQPSDSDSDHHTLEPSTTIPLSSSSTNQSPLLSQQQQEQQTIHEGEQNNALIEQSSQTPSSSFHVVDEMMSLVHGVGFLIRHGIHECFSFKRYLFHEELEMYTRDPPSFPFLLVNIGSGVSILRVDNESQYVRVGGSSLGGGTFYGLCRVLTGCTSFHEALTLAQKGKGSKVDLLVNDIYGRDYSALGLSGDTIAASFGKLVRMPSVAPQAANGKDGSSTSQHHASSIGGGASTTNGSHPAAAGTFQPIPGSNVSREDLAKAALVMITNNICSLAHLYARQVLKVPSVVFVGNFLRNNLLAMRMLSYALAYWSGNTIEAIFLKHEGYFGAVGSILPSVVTQEQHPTPMASEPTHAMASASSPTPTPPVSGPTSPSSLPSGSSSQPSSPPS